MHILLRFLGGMFIVAIGSILVIKSEWFLQNFGAVAWAEEHLGLDGGTRLFYKLIGILFVLIGIAIATGMAGNVALGILAPLFGGRVQPQ